MKSTLFTVFTFLLMVTTACAKGVDYDEDNANKILLAMQKAAETYPQIESQDQKNILDSARALFLNHGYGATSIEDIASEAGVSIDVVYAFYPNKEELAADLLEQWRIIELGNFQVWIEEAKKVETEPLRQSIAFVKNIEDFAGWYAVNNGVVPGDVWAAFVADHENHSPESMEMVSSGLREWSVTMEAQFAEIYNCRTSKTSATAADLAHQLTILIEGTIVLSRAWQDAYLLTRQLRQFRMRLPLLFHAPNKTAPSYCHS